MQPKSPNKDFDFMLKQDKPAKRGLLMPALPKPAKIGLSVLGAIIVVIIISSLLSGRKSGSTTAFEGALARAQETLRVTTFVQQKLSLKDPQTQALAATVNSALSSDKQQITSYLAQNHINVSAAQLAADTDKTTDTSLQSAAQNNSLDAAYVNYLKSALGKYATDLQNTYKLTGPNGKKILAGTFESTRTLLNSPPVKT
jgi:hypothetical protein